MKISKTILLFFILLTISCTSSKSKKQATIYQKQCSSCHLAPSINDLPKDIWAEKILPDMGARMGMKDTAYNPMKGLSFSEQHIINQTGVYPMTPSMSESDWETLKEYIISMAPGSIPTLDHSNSSSELIQFLAKPISLDSTKGSLITFLEYDIKDKNLKIGDISGNLTAYNFLENKTSSIGQFGSAVIAHTKNEDNSYTTAIGKLDPSEFSSGRVFTLTDGNISPVTKILHRPVNTLVADLNKDGKEELVVSEFGNLTGKLSLLTKTDSTIYKKSILLNQPGTIRVLSKDMDNNGKEDLIALTSQGDETITILYQQDDLRFIAEKVIRFSPIYGISWFELIDYDGDGDDDIILSSFTYVFTPVPDDLSKYWNEKNADLMILENKLKN